MTKKDTTTKDPLFYGTVHIRGTDLPKLQSGSKILSELSKLMKENKFLDTVLYASDDTMDFFKVLFPEIVDSNDIGNLKKEDFEQWKPNKNNISIELDPNPGSMHEKAKDVYIGGPAALFAAAVQGNDKEASHDVLYGHDGMRGLSNWKGSASYFHIRDAIPVYYWPDNSGVYTLYCTVKHFLQRHFYPSGYEKEFSEDPNFNKLRLNVKSLLKEPLLFPQLFLKNVFYTVKDVNMHLTKQHMIEPAKSTAYVAMEHARLTKEIIPKIDLEKPILMNSSESASALHLHLGKGAEASRNVFKNLQRIDANAMRHRRLSYEEIRQRGYDPELVQEGLEFSNDGYIVPYADQQLGKIIEQNGGKINNNMILRKVLVAPTKKKNDYQATKIVWKDAKNGSLHTTPVKTLHLSLGPSVKQLNVIPPKYSLYSHLSDVLKSNLSLPGKDTINKVEKTCTQQAMYVSTIKSLLRHAANTLVGTNLLHRTMWASGLSSTVLIKVDKSKVTESNMVKFRDHIGAHNKHCVRLAEKEVIIDEKPHQMFVLQVTGGGHFPIKDIHAEAAINVLKATFIQLLNLNQDGVEFDFISARSCARGVSAQNVFRITAPLANTVMIYGIGGIGITTMAGNALLMKAVLQQRTDLSEDKITAPEFRKKMETSDFSTIPHWKWSNPFSRNYAQFIDSVNDPREVSRVLGHSKTPFAVRRMYKCQCLKMVTNLTKKLTRFIK